jgi:hypothetical protein
MIQDSMDTDIQRTTTIFKAYHNPDEDVYSVLDMPTKEQANKSGEVLWYAQGHGWYVGNFWGGYMPRTTHWTLIPDRPGVEIEDVALRDIQFEKYMNGFSKEVREALKSTMVSAFNDGWNRGRSSDGQR